MPRILQGCIHLRSRSSRSLEGRFPYGGRYGRILTNIAQRKRSSSARLRKRKMTKELNDSNPTYVRRCHRCERLYRTEFKQGKICPRCYPENAPLQMLKKRPRIRRCHYCGKIYKTLFQHSRKCLDCYDNYRGCPQRKKRIRKELKEYVRKKNNSSKK